jgi:4-diphosphocytidyl-2C-methyl-D-erythritol kinase
VLVSSGVHVATAEAYGGLGRNLTFIASSSSINNFQSFVRALGDGRSAKAASALSANDFEAVVFRKYPQLAAIQRRLWRHGAAGVRMTGSGSAVFAIFESRKMREAALAGLEADRVLRDCGLMAASLVSRKAYRRMWRRQLREHLHPDQTLWPPHARYGR